MPSVVERGPRKTEILIYIYIENVDRSRVYFSSVFIVVGRWVRLAGAEPHEGASNGLTRRAGELSRWIDLICILKIETESKRT